MLKRRWFCRLVDYLSNEWSNTSTVVFCHNTQDASAVPGIGRFLRVSHKMMRGRKKKTYRTSCQTQAGIGHCAPANRGGHVQNRSRRRQGLRGKINPARRRSKHAWTKDQAGRQKRAKIDAVGGWRVHTADGTPSRNAATRSKHCNFMCQGDIRPRAAAGSSRNGKTRAVAAITGTRLVGNVASNTASAWSDPEHTRKRSSRRSVSATELSRPGIHWHSNSRCSMWHHLCSLAA